MQLNGSQRQQAWIVAKAVAAAIGTASLLVVLGGCASIPQRAWDNGRAMSSSNAYYSLMRGDRSFQTARQLYSTMDPYRSLYTPRPFTPFSHW